MTTLNKISFALFSIITAIILFTLFPMIICPVMWMLFLVAIIAQCVPLKPLALILRVLTVLLLLFVAFRIYYNFTNDFKINPPQNLAYSFAIFAGIYLLGTITMYVSKNIQKYTQYLSIVLAGAAGYQGYTLVTEMYSEVHNDFKKEHPEYIVLDNIESKRYLHTIDTIYVNSKSASNGFVSHQTSKPIDGYSYRIMFSNGSMKGSIPIFSVEKSKDTVAVSKIMFRYENDSRYGFIHYETFLPTEKVVTDEDSAQIVLNQYFHDIGTIMKN